MRSVQQPGLRRRSRAGRALAAAVLALALGDSYAAGYGLTPVTGEPVPGCAQAEDDYPHRVSAALNTDLADVSCAGAVTADLAGPGQETPDGTAAPQLDAITSLTSIVTVTIGGNDAGFTELALACAALSATGPVAGSDGSFTAPDCRSAFVVDGTDILRGRVESTVVANIAGAFEAIRQRAPSAAVFVVGYPALLPESGGDGCFRPVVDAGGAPIAGEGVPFTDTDVAYLATVEASIDGTLRAAADDAGFSFVDLRTPSLAHTLCSGDPWISGAEVTASADGLELVPGSLHPNEAGVAATAALVVEAIGDRFPAHSVDGTGDESGRAVPDAPAGLGVAAGVALVAAGVAAGVTGIILIRRRRR